SGRGTLGGLPAPLTVVPRVWDAPAVTVAPPRPAPFPGGVRPAYDRVAPVAPTTPVGKTCAAAPSRNRSPCPCGPRRHGPGHDPGGPWARRAGAGGQRLGKLLDTHRRADPGRAGSGRAAAGGDVRLVPRVGTLRDRPRRPRQPDGPGT